MIAFNQSSRSVTLRITDSLRIKTKTPELNPCICAIAIPFAGVEAGDRQEWLRYGIYRTLAVRLLLGDAKAAEASYGTHRALSPSRANSLSPCL